MENPFLTFLDIDRNPPKKIHLRNYTGLYEKTAFGLDFAKLEYIHFHLHAFSG